MSHSTKHFGSGTHPPQSDIESKQASSDKLSTLLEQLFDQAGAPPHMRRTICSKIQNEVLAALEDADGANRGIKLQAAVVRTLQPLILSTSVNRHNILPRKLSRTEYRLACISRSSKFRDDLLLFHRAYPVVLVRLGLRTKCRFQPPPWLAPFLEQRDQGTYLVRFVTLDQLRCLQGTALDLMAVQQEIKILWPADGHEYFTASGYSKKAYRIDLRGLMAKWPSIPRHVWETGDLRDATRQTVLMPSFLKESNSAVEWLLDQYQEDVARAAKEAKLMIPIYADTTEAEINWKTIQEAKKLIYGTKIPRTREKALGLRLEVWDRYQNTRSFAAVTKEMRLPRSTVKHHFLVACRDIEGQVPTGSVKQRRLVGFNPETHVSQCTQCQSGTALCPAAEAYANKDYEALKDLLGQGENPEESVNRNLARRHYASSSRKPPAD